MRLALFDLDNTLLSADTDSEWLEFLVDVGAAPRSALRANEEMGRRYRRGEAAPLEYARFYLSYYPAHDMATLFGWRARFVEERIRPRMPPEARNLIARHLHDLSVIITATNRFLTEPIAAALGVKHLIATEPRIVDGRFTGEVVGAPCMREGKLEHLERWLAARGRALGDFSESWFYSDSINDLPLLERVTHAVAVDPDARLEEAAAARAWKILRLPR
jgi:HAD superfamily hydrolase (TIGR01490 family)